jgi:hypothetical protein
VDVQLIAVLAHWTRVTYRFSVVARGQQEIRMRVTCFGPSPASSGDISEQRTTL